MNLLAIDTSSIACSVALRFDGNVTERHEEKAKEHTRLLTPMIRDLLATADVKLQYLDAIVLGNGPGSFIGMRIAASVAQGLAHGASLKIVPVSSLAAVAVQAFAESDAAEVVVAQDAHMNEVYLGAYTSCENRIPEPMFAERLHAQSPIEELDLRAASNRVAAGYGWQRYPGLARINAELIGHFSDVLYPRAVHLLPLGDFGLRQNGGIEPQDLMPAYLRSKVAEKPAPAKS